MLRIPLNSFVCPIFEYQVLEVSSDVIPARDRRGHIRRGVKGRASISNIVKHLVSSREDWERVMAERLPLTLEGRLPTDWPQIREQLKQRDAPLGIGGHSGMTAFYHATRYLLGPEDLLSSFSDQPDLVKDIVNHLADLYVYLADQLLSQIGADLAFLTEDLGLMTGPFISPAVFRGIVLPCHKKLTGVLGDHGVDA